MVFTIVVSGDRLTIKYADTTLATFTSNPDDRDVAKIVGSLPGLDERVVSWANALPDDATLNDPVILQREIITPPPPSLPVEEEELEIPTTRDGLLLSRAEMEEFAKTHGIPLQRVNAAYERQARVGRKTYTSSVKRVDEDLRDHVLREIQQSWASYPVQSKEFVAKETHRIAKEVFGEDDHTSVMRVAGVRAAMSRGVYG